MSSIEALPNEIISAILSSLTTPDLQQTLLISHRFRALSEISLYSAVSIQENVVLNGSQDGGPYKTWRWCRTILERPHLVDFVRTLTIRWFTDNHRIRLHLSTNSPYYPSGSGTASMVDEIDLEPVFIELATILPSLVLLQSLELHLTSSHTSGTGMDPRLILGSRLLSSLTFPNLSQLTLTGLIPPPDFFLPASVPKLSTLRLTDVHDLPYQFPRTAVPHLTSFKGSPAAAAAILPDRPVKTLSLVGYEYLKVPEWQGINRVQPAPSFDGLEGIETLDLSGMCVTPTLLCDVAKWIPTVRVLKVRLALRHTLHHAFGGISLLTALSPVLLSLTHLKLLDFSPTVGIGRARVEEELALCQEWSQVCGVKKVVFPSGDVWVLTTPATSVDGHDGGKRGCWVLAGGNSVEAPAGNLINCWWRECPPPPIVGVRESPLEAQLETIQQAL